MDLDERIRNSLIEFADELWLKRRLKLQEVIDRVERLVDSKDNAESLSILSSWIRFVQFLEAECSGQHFNNDKQWSALMNLMQISRKLNHRTVKFKDVIRNKHLIEANESSIRKLNGNLRLCQTIVSSLDQLELILTKDCQLVLKPDQQQEQLDELLKSKSFLENRCRSNLYTLQLELDTDVTASCAPQLQLCSERVEKLIMITGELGKLLDNLQHLYCHLLQLSPLVNVDRNLDLQYTNGPDLLYHSVGTCKRAFADVQEFCGKLMEFLYGIASGSNKKKSTSKDRILSLALIKLVNSEGQLTRNDLLVSGLRESISKLDECRKTLDSVIQGLRLEFGRFYFVSDLELLTMIALDSRLIVDKSYSQHAKHLLGKLFNNSIEEFIVNKQLLIGIRSPCDEIISFTRPEVGPIQIKKSTNLYSVEIVRIFNETLRKLRKTLQIELANSLATEKQEIDWSLPVQLLTVADNIKFCQKVETCLRGEGCESSLKEVTKYYEERFKKLSCSKPQEIQSLMNQSDRLVKLKLSAIISLTVHFISTLGTLNGASCIQDWRWLKLARYYQRFNDGKIEVRISDTSFDYKFDFLAPQVNDSSDGPQSGGFKRLISTNITQRCLLTASQSIGNFRLGSSPFGPAGSGKTESIKALGFLLGCHVIVHNCDESNDGQSLDRLVWGLAHTGLWGCFDEFNRLSASALSSISASLELVQASIREAKRMVELPDGRMMPVDNATAFFVTMNPADSTKGYLGRRRLPANLKQLFIPIAMTRVEIEAIVSESLLALGAELEGQYCLEPQQAKLLASRLAKFTEHLQQELVQRRTTCMWDLRLVLAILKRLKHLAKLSKFLTSNNEESLGGDTVLIQFQILLLHSIGNEIKPRLSECDLNVFNHILDKNFPRREIETFPGPNLCIDNEDKLFQDKLKRAAMNLFPVDTEVATAVQRHALQLKQQLDSRAGVILLGPSGSGKSTSWRLLQTVLGNLVNWIPINPRACPREALFGLIEEATGKWIDGLLTTIVRVSLQMLLDSDDLHQVWLVLDGPIDPDWIESFNSVLDDNQVLTLGSGERLSFSPTPNKSIKLLIECDSLEFASPASISRLGLVLHEPIQPNRYNLILSISLGPNNWLEELKMASDMITSNRKQTVSLVVISGQYQSQRSEFTRKLLDTTIIESDSQCIEYNCSPLSTCDNLLDLVTSVPRDDLNGRDYMFVINNVQLINVENEWKTKSFMELLRFIVTYGGFYDKQYDKLRKINATFMVTIDSVNHIDPRTLAKGCSISLESHRSENESDGDMKTHDGAGQTLLTRYKEDNSCPIITLSSSEYCSGRRSSIMEKLNKHFSILTFRNSKEALESVEALRELLDKCFGKATNSRDTKMFLLNELEHRLMNQELKSKLYHQLNRLKARHKVAKFVYLSHNIDHQEAVAEATFWRSLGPVVLMNNMAPETRRISTRDLSDDEFARIKSSLEQLKNEETHSSKINSHRSRIYLATVVCLIKRSKIELDKQSRTFGNGLSRLEKFERQIEKVKLRCKSDELELDRRKNDIVALVRSIDEALEGSKIQRDELNKLKQQQLIKQRHLEQQSEELNRELSEVCQLVDRSKVDLGQFLKPEALNEIKALRSPPATIKDILDVLFTLLRIEDCSWPSMRAHLTKYSLRDELTSYDFQKNLDESLLNKATALIRMKSESFTQQQAARASVAVVPILGWIKATIEYGKVLVRLKPLKDQMAQLETESTSLDKAARDLEVRLAELGTRIGNDSNQLSQLRLEYDESQRFASGVRDKLNKAQLARCKLEGQIGRWHQRLASIVSLLQDRRELVALCSMTVAMILFYDFRTDNDQRLGDWIKMFGMKGADSRVELATKMMNLTTISDSVRGSIKSKVEHVDRILQLLCMRIHLELAVCDSAPHLPPILLDASLTNETMLNQDEMMQYLAFESLLCQKLDVTIVKFDQTTNCIQAIEMALRFDKLVVIEMDDHNESSDLDILEHFFIKRSFADSGNDKRQRILLSGRLDKHPSVGHLVRSIKLLTGCISIDEIRSSVVEFLLESHEIELSTATRKLERELYCKQQDCCNGELQLLNRLATMNIKDDDCETLLEGELIHVLDDLHNLNSSLDTVASRLSEKQAEIKVKQEAFKRFTDEISQFYFEHLAKLGEQNKLYGFPLKSYINLLTNDKKKQDEITQLPTTSNYIQIIKRATQCMRPDFRLQFKLRLVDSKRDVASKAGRTDEDSCRHKLARILSDEGDSSIQVVINELLQNIIQNGYSQGDRHQTRPALVVVLHDPTKSSPQLEIDEFFRQQQQQLGSSEIQLNYSKFYASSDSPNRIGMALNRVMTGEPNELSKNLKGPTTKVFRCICIANAHLASLWLNSHLVKLLNSAPSQTRAIIILIGESSNDEDVEFDSNLLDAAQVKYWHDDSVSELTGRFDLFARSMLSNQVVGTYFGGETGWARELNMLAEQTILFHVVCQEKTRPFHGQHNGSHAKLAELGWASSSYSFDYEQLCLAMKTLFRLENKNSEKNLDQLRDLYCHLLADFVYGSRMVTLEDEKILNELIVRFLGSNESARLQMSKLKEIKAIFASGNKVDYDSQLRNLILGE